MFKYFSLLLLFILCLGACASKPNASKAKGKTFTTDIHANGSKRFVIEIMYSNPRAENKQGRQQGSDKKKGQKGGNKSGDRGKGQERSGSRPPRSGARESSDADLGEQKREEIIALLNEKLEETGYCRHGFIELDYFTMRDSTELIGECQESASEADRQLWE